MATYLATVQIGRYELHTDRRATCRSTPCSPGACSASLRRRVRAASARCSTRSPGSSGPTRSTRYTVVVTDDDLEIPLESQGLSTFGANFLTTRLGRRPAGRPRAVAPVVRQQPDPRPVAGHLAARGLRLLRRVALVRGVRRADRPRARRRAPRPARATSTRTCCSPTPGPELMFDDRVYKRGALLLHALRLTVGDDAFFDLLRAWTDKHAHGTVNTEAFVEFADLTTGHELGELFDAWLHREALPALPAAR